MVAGIIASRLSWSRAYLWMDSLCIIQDDPEDWAAESVKMCDIYSGSFLMIAATNAQNSDQGLFALQDKIYTARAISRKDEDGTKYPLYCRSSLPHWKSKSYIDATFTPEEDFEHFPLLARAWGNGMYAIVKEYSSLRLTYASDRLPALAGIAKQFAPLHTMHCPDESTHRQSGYIASLWEDTLLSDLLWSTHNMRCKPSTSPAPSWSWSSIDGFIYYPPEILIDSCYSIVSATIETASDPFLSAPSGHLTITAPLVTGRIDSNFTAEHSLAVQNLALRLKNETYTISYPQLKLDYGGNGGRLQIKEGDILSCARLARIKQAGEQFLLLKPSERHDGFYERIGLIQLGSIDKTGLSDAERIYEGSPIMTLTVV
ncbi:putative Heterokaryon incompatibility domain-containing protein [Seiridium cardinale]|uniref:Heterokaryon incompatibility domain-containing protein n=1 Tax=Seiridium cardinale TaxID=138064 RepID=A0ABR2XI08_9PEZI